ncbi:MAG: IS66 family transposase [Planctomycetes bacterium]|jgi:transposase|nr:IS66 family transposase [Planctomycetota bacterium]
MSLATAKLPTDLTSLQAFAEALQAEFSELRTRTAHELAARDAELHAKTLHIEKLKLQLALLRNARFGRSSEKLDRDIEQLELLIGDLEEGHADTPARPEAAAAPSKPETTRDALRPAPARRSFPEHLERVPVEHPAACVCPACGGTNLTVVGTDEREVLEYVPSHFRVMVHRRPKVSCRGCETMTQPPMPALPIERGTPGPGLLAHVLVAKYCDHLPLHRQTAIYARDGVELDRSTLADWVGKMAYHLRPLADAITDYVRAGPVLHADDTPVPVLDPGRGRTRTGRLWVAVRDERPWGSTAPPAVCYRYSPDRKAERAASLLLGSRGYLHADGYSGFAGLYRPDPITGRIQFEEVACWAHARRKLHEVHLATQSAAAKGLLEDIGELFAIEASIRGRSPEDRRAIRQEQAVPRLERLHERLEHVVGSISRKSSLAEAIRYALVRWPALTRYASDGRLEMSNNAAERAIRPLAVGRKNWVFAGSDTGGDRAAVMYTLVETAKLSGIDPEAYLRHVIARIADHPAKRIAELLPWNVNI